MKEDCELLAQFVEEESHEAFAEIVRRHLDLVHSVAMRQVAGDEHLAKDVCQEVFALLARKAASLKGRRVVSGWLYCAAKFEANRAVRKEVLRRTREREAGMENEIDESEPQVDWEQARPLLDEAIAELGESERDAICLRFYESRRFKEIGERLDVSENTARMRVNRSLDKLRDLLQTKGIKSSAATLAVALGGQATIAAPVGLAQAISASAAVATGSGLLAGIIGIMNTTKIIGLVAVSAAAVGAGVYLTQDDKAPEPVAEHRVEHIAIEQPPDQTEVGESVAPRETEDERLQRLIDEHDKLEASGIVGKQELEIRADILKSEMALQQKKEDPTKSLSDEEKRLVKRLIKLMKTDKTAANNLLVSSLSENSSSAMYYFAGNMYAESGEKDLALDFFKTALARNKRLVPRLDNDLNRNIGIILATKGSFEEAKPYLQEAIYRAKEPDHVLHGLMGLSEVNAGNYAASEYHYKQAVALNPESHDWSMGLANALRSQEKHQEAIDVLESLLERGAKE